MTTKKVRPNTVTEYINAAPKEVRAKLREIRKCILQSAPGAVEGMKWGMPAYSYKRILVTFAAYKHHIGFHPTPTTLLAFADELGDFVTWSTTVQFPLDKPLPLPLIRKITAFRVQESLEQDGKWRTPMERKKS